MSGTKLPSIHFSFKKSLKIVSKLIFQRLRREFSSSPKLSLTFHPLIYCKALLIWDINGQRTSFCPFDSFTHFLLILWFQIKKYDQAIFHGKLLENISRFTVKCSFKKFLLILIGPSPPKFTLFRGSAPTLPSQGKQFLLWYFSSEI